MTEIEQTGAGRVELLRMIECLAREAASREEELMKLKQDLTDARSAMSYWSSQNGITAARMKELEHRINELTSPLAELARASKE